MTDKALEILRCPLCGAGFSLSENGKSILCNGPKRHCWDIASSGFVNFSGSHGGDSKEAVGARRRFLERGPYKILSDMLVSLISVYSPGEKVCDAGCGEGYYSAAIAADGNHVVGFDLSRPAIEAASKRKLKRAFFAVAGINAMPVSDGAFDSLVNIFAPCFDAEFARVLTPGGIMILVGAGPRHLYEFKSAIYDSPTENGERADLPVSLREIGKRRLTYRFTVKGGDDANDLFAMTPYYYRTSPVDASRLASIADLSVTADFDIRVYQKD